jgi:hypothetical protein
LNIYFSVVIVSCSAVAQRIALPAVQAKRHGVTEGVASLIIDQDWALIVMH